MSKPQYAMTQLLSLLVFIGISTAANASLEYQSPSPEIAALAKAALPPVVAADSQGRYLLQLSRDLYPSIKTLSEPELRLAGLRVNPKKNISSRLRYYNGIAIQFLGNAERDPSAIKNQTITVPDSSLPAGAQIAYVTWSPDERHVAFTLTEATGVALWVLEVASAKARQLTETTLNANLGRPFTWAADSQSLIIKVVPDSRKPLINPKQAVPTGPTVSTSQGEKAQNRTYQDLLKTPDDAFNFEQLALSELRRVELDGRSQHFLPPALFRELSFSPNGDYLMITKVKRPFSYLVPYYRFASETEVRTKEAGFVVQLIDRPLEEERAKGFMAVTKERRRFSWRGDVPATVTWVLALDEGDPKTEAAYRDQIFEWRAPFNGAPTSLVRTQNRVSSIHWGNATTAIVEDYWFDNRNTKTYRFNPSEPNTPAQKIFDRDSQDQYGDPGRFAKVHNDLNQEVLALTDNRVLLLGEGYSERGQYPFIDSLDLQSGKSTRLYQSDSEDSVESFVSILNLSAGQVLVRIEGPDAYPNYHLRNIKEGRIRQITQFKNPYAALGKASKQLITYNRKDGLPLSGTLYLPPEYKRDSGEKLPLLLWAYPVEYKDNQSAGQKTTNANAFTYPYYGSPIFWVLRGFAVLDDAAFPIVGEGDAEPNDQFREQLIANAAAAIDAIDRLGYIDRQRVAVGGHSYGAFMVANLLSHSDLFAAGIARSGAYNRTLTPFGFQREERTYWDAPNVYNAMSPFMHADKMKTPLLLIHGEADNNSGTYPMQSERYFNALKGLGATARLVVLPKESHGYRAKESILHLLWEQDQWLQRYVAMPNPK